jgi:hypothetical protein
VISINNQLQVKVMNDDRRADAEVRGGVLRALMLDSLAGDLRSRTESSVCQARAAPTVGRPRRLDGWSRLG